MYIYTHTQAEDSAMRPGGRGGLFFRANVGAEPGLGDAGRILCGDPPGGAEQPQGALWLWQCRDQ